MPPITELTRIELIHRERLARPGVFTTGDVLRWRDEALLLNLAGLGSAEHDLFAFAGFDGLGAVLKVDLDTFHAAVARAAGRLQVTPPTDLVIETWWEQARTLHDE